MEHPKQPSINSEYCDHVYLNVSKALNIFVKRYQMKFEEVDVVLHRLEEEWNQKKMDLYFRYCMDIYGNKPANDHSYIK